MSRPAPGDSAVGQATRAEVDAARLLLDRLGVTVEQLLDTPMTARDMPTFNEYISLVSKAVSPGTLRVYEPYWKRIRAFWGERRLDEPSALEIRQFAARNKENAVVRRNARGGRTAAEHTISAFRCLYFQAEADKLISHRDNPAIQVAKPKRLSSHRRALRDVQLGQINTVARTTGNDPDLDTLIVRLHVETACRRGGALALRRIDLDTDQCLIHLHEKGETDRWQPVSPTLMRSLIAHWNQRGDGNSLSTGQLLRYRNGRPITSRRYDGLWVRIGQHLPWAASQGVSAHWLRHTTLTWVERHFGYGVARAYAGHNDRTDLGVTSTYIRAEIYEVALALAALTGEPHPLASR
jgi:integrase/recombinase XerC